LVVKERRSGQYKNNGGNKVKKMNLEIDLSFIKGNEKNTIPEVWEGFIIQGSRTTYKDGVNLKMQRTLIKIIDKIKVGTMDIELEDAEYDVMVEIQERGKFDPAYSRVGSQIMEKIEEAKK
jgi:hypothetical protein